MTIVDTGIYGAKRQSYSKASPRDLLKRIIDDNSGADEKKLHQLFADVARDDPEMVEAMTEYWFANNYRSLVHAKPRITQPIARARATRVEALKEQIKVAAVRLVLLDTILPNGKALRDATGKDCAKAGGWLTKIAKAIKPTQKVGDALSETDVRKLYRS